MNKASTLATALVVMLTGCATQTTLYDWGNYEQDLFNYYHEPSLKTDVIADHATFVLKVKESGETPAPGLLAEAGTFYLQEGDIASAVKFYQLEYEIWPESRPMMGILIENLEGN